MRPRPATPFPLPPLPQSVRHRLRRAGAALLLTLCSVLPAHALALADLSNQEASSGLKEALTQGAGRAIDQLGRTNGFLNNPRVHIPLPDSLHKAAGLLRTFGQGDQADALETTINHAAEAAMPEARKLLTEAIAKMSVADAKAVLTGGDDALTQYFRRTTAAPLGEKFRPIVGKAITKVKLAEQYDQFAGKAAKYGLLKEEDAHLDRYVTAKALDGLYLMIAEEEKQIRQNPAAAAGKLAKQVFGLLK